MKLTVFLVVCALTVLVFAEAEADHCAKTTGKAAHAEKKSNKAEFVENFLTKYDADENGALSKKEFPSTDEKFDKIDADSDGSVTLEELKASHQEWAKEEFARSFLKKYDADEDGVLSKKEFPGTDEKFDKIDADSGGSVTLEELIACHAKRTKRTGEFHKEKHHKKEKGTSE